MNKKGIRLKKKNWIGIYDISVSMNRGNITAMQLFERPWKANHQENRLDLSLSEMYVK